MANKQEQIIDIAEGHFRRFGYARTTMADVAKAARLSRAGLYLTFPGKEELFATVIARVGERAFARIRQEARDKATATERLAVACEIWGAQGFEYVQENPEARDMFDPQLAPVRALYEDFERLLLELLSPAQIPIENLLGLVRLTSWALRGFKDMAADSAQFRALLPTLVAAIAAQLEPPGPPATP